MRNLPLTFLGLLVFCLGCNTAAETERADRDESKPAIDSRISSTDEPRPDDEAAARRRFQALNEKLDADIEQLKTVVANAATDQQKHQLFESQNPVPAFVDDLMRLARDYPRTETGLTAAMAAVERSKGLQNVRAMDLLLNRYIDRLNLDEVAASLLEKFPSQHIESWLQKIVEHAPDEASRAKALFNLFTFFDQIAFYRSALANNPHVAKTFPAEQLQYINAQRTEADVAELESLLQTLIDEYGDLNYQGDQTYGTVAQRELYELQHLSVGDIAPEIAGKDLDGAEFKLSDYRGKVVMLDFWGHWCPPCRAMYPHEQLIVDKTAGLPFVLIGVNSDNRLEVAQRAVRDDKLPWRNFWDGPRGTNGPISQQWNITAWPTVYLIDGNGVIRFKDILDTDLDRAIEQLMAEAGHPVDLSRAGGAE